MLRQDCHGAFEANESLGSYIGQLGYGACMDNVEQCWISAMVDGPNNGATAAEPTTLTIPDIIGGSSLVKKRFFDIEA